LQWKYVDCKACKFELGIIIGIIGQGHRTVQWYKRHKIVSVFKALKFVMDNSEIFGKTVFIQKT
jgi:hypothetical protein